MNQSEIENFYSNNLFTHITNDGDARKHSHMVYEIVYMLGGTTNHTNSTITNTVTAGDLFIIFPGQIHYFDKHSPTVKHRDVCIEQKVFEECCSFISDTFLEDLKKSSISTIWHLSNEDLTFIEYNFQNYVQNFHKQSEIDIKILILTLTKFFLNQPKNSPQSDNNFPIWLNEFLPRFQTPEYMKEGLPAIMSFCNYHPVYACRIFKKYTGVSMSEYLLICRLKYASTLLLLTNKTVTEIALNIGFSSIAYFNKSFKKFYNLTPSEFRRNHITPPPSINKYV